MTSLFINITLSEKCLTKFFQIRNPNTSSGCIFPVVPFGIVRILFYSWSGHCTKAVKEAKPVNKEIKFFKIPKGTTGNIQLLGVFGFQIWKNFVRHFSDNVILMNSDVNLHLRNNIIKLQSLIHNELSSPRYINIFKQGWFKSNYIDKKPENFDNPVEFGFGGCKI